MDFMIKVNEALCSYRLSYPIFTSTVRLDGSFIIDRKKQLPTYFDFTAQLIQLKCMINSPRQTQDTT
jgi:hypothetical protein